MMKSALVRLHHPDFEMLKSSDGKRNKNKYNIKHNIVVLKQYHNLSKRLKSHRGECGSPRDFFRGIGAKSKQIWQNVLESWGCFGEGEIDGAHYRG